MNVIRRQRWWRLVPAVVAGVLVGCGSSGGGSDHQQVANTVKRYLTAQADGDGSTACGLLAPAGATQLIAFVSQDLPSVATCEDAINKLPEVIGGSSALRDLKFARVQNVQVRNASARADAVNSSLGAPQPASLQKVGGSWKISGIPGLGAR